jgi:hypothetical protein
MVRWPLIGLLLDDDNDDGAVCGMSIGKGSRSTRRIPPPVHFVDHKSHMT